MQKLSKADRRDVLATVDELAHARDVLCDGCGLGGPCQSDCYQSDVVILDAGYADVTIDGDVWAHGRLVALGVSA